MTVLEIKDKFDYFWVFLPKLDSWRLARKLGSTDIVGVSDGGLWVIHTDFNEGWEAIGVEMPKHPRSVMVPKDRK